MFTNSSSHVEMYCTFLQIWLLAIKVFEIISMVEFIIVLASQCPLFLEWKCKIMERLGFWLFKVLYSKPDSEMKRKVSINA